MTFKMNEKEIQDQLMALQLEMMLGTSGRAMHEIIDDEARLLKLLAQDVLDRLNRSKKLDD